MKKIIIAALAAGVVILGALVVVQQTEEISNFRAEINKLEQKVALEVAKNDPDRLSNHQREVWISLLEWCESHGIMTAINSEDLDGTPSYYSFQFKPETFLSYGIKYAFLLKGTTLTEAKILMKNYDLARQIVRAMIDDPTVKLEKEFPACIKKIGLPPKKF